MITLFFLLFFNQTGIVDQHSNETFHVNGTRYYHTRLVKGQEKSDQTRLENGQRISVRYVIDDSGAKIA